MRLPRLVRPHGACETDESEHGNIRLRLTFPRASRSWLFGQRRNSADSRCTGRKRRSRYQGAVTLGARRATGHTRTSIGVAGWEGWRETIGQRLKEGDDQIFLM